MALSRFGRAFLSSLKSSRPEEYRRLEASGQLKQEAQAVDDRANIQYSRFLSDLMVQHGLPASHVERASALAGLSQQAEELVMSELLVKDEETEKAEQQGGYLDDAPTQT